MVTIFEGLGQEMILPDGESFIVSDPGPVPQDEMTQVQGLAGGHAGILRGLWAVVGPDGSVVAVVRGRARSVRSGYQLKRIRKGTAPQDLMRAREMLKSYYQKGLNPGPLTSRQQAFLKKKKWWNYKPAPRQMPIRDQLNRMPKEGPGPAQVPSSGTWGLGQAVTDNGGSIMIRDDAYPSSGPGPSRVPGQGTWGLGDDGIPPHAWPRTVEDDVDLIRAGGARPAYPKGTPGIPETLGASLYFEEGDVGTNMNTNLF